MTLSSYSGKKSGDQSEHHDTHTLDLQLLLALATGKLDTEKSHLQCKFSHERGEGQRVGAGQTGS